MGKKRLVSEREKMKELPVILYGAAPQNLRTAYEIIEPAGYEIQFICDKDPMKQGKVLYEIPVISPEKLREYESRMEPYHLVITVRTAETVAEIKKELTDLKYADISTLEEFNYAQRLNEKIKSLGQIVVHITDHCNLNCVRCSHFSPIAEKFYLRKNEFERDMKRLSEILNRKLPEIQMGGRTAPSPRMC